MKVSSSLPVHPSAEQQHAEIFVVTCLNSREPNISSECVCLQALGVRKASSMQTHLARLSMAFSMTWPNLRLRLTA